MTKQDKLDELTVAAKVALALLANGRHIDRAMRRLEDALLRVEDKP